jgi:spermidine synthase
MEHENTSGMDLWVQEIYHGDFGMKFRAVRTLFSGQSPFQRVDIIETAGHGRMLLNDGKIMLTERDEFVYHEMMAHVPLYTHPCPERVLIIGGGDGGTAREVLRHKGVKRCVLVEIDKLVVEACKEHLPRIGAWDDPRLDVKIEDGIAFARNTDEMFDVVLVDSTDPVGPATVLFSREFYRDVARVLAPDGILVAQAESPFFDQDIQREMFQNQRPFFSRLHLYLISNLSYPGGLWSLSFASKGLCPLTDARLPDARNDGLATRYYNTQIHRGAFLLPAFAKDGLLGAADSVDWPAGA